jgi:LuxR family maltose regulon positive regulatory protein
LLESFEQSSLLIVPLDRKRHWYRCHHLLAQMLRAELERTEPEMVSRLHDRASAWFEANDDPSYALDHAQLAGDGDRAAMLFCKIGPTFQAAGRTDTVSRWLRWFEEQDLIRRYPQVSALGAILEALNGERAYSLLLADSAVAGDMDSPVPDGSRLGGWVSAMEACLCRQGVDRMRDDAGRAAELLSLGSPLRGPVIVLEGVAALMQGDSAAADQLFVVGAELCLRSGNAPSHAMSLAERAVVALDQGDRSGARVLSEQAVKVVEEMRIEAYVDAVLVYAVAARTAAQSGELQDAQRYVAASARLRPRCTAAIPWSAQFLIQLAQAYLALGDGVGVRAVLRQIRDILLVTPDLGLLAQKCAELSQLLGTITVGSSGASSLTAAELRLLPLLATHLTHHEIGERLYVSRNTIKSQAMSVYRKLGASSRGEAVRTAEQIGLLGR